MAAFFIRRSDKQKPVSTKTHGSTRVDRLSGHGTWLAFVTGIVLKLVPGVLPFIAMKDIRELNCSTPATIAVIVGFSVVMFTPVEAPLVAFFVAPERTARTVDSFNVWLARNARKLAWWALAVFGAVELLRGHLST